MFLFFRFRVPRLFWISADHGFAAARDAPKLLVCLDGIAVGPTRDMRTLQLSATFLAFAEDTPVVIAAWHAYVRRPPNIRVSKLMRKLLAIEDLASLDTAPELGIALESLHLVTDRLSRAISSGLEPVSALEGGPESALLHTFELVASDAKADSSFRVGDHAADWSTVLSPVGDAEADRTALARMQEALGFDRGEAGEVMFVTDGPWLLGSSLAKQVRHDGLTSKWRRSMSDWWNIRWTLCRAEGRRDAKEMRMRDQMTLLDKSGIDRGSGPTYRARRLASIVCDILIDRKEVPCINDCLVPNAIVMSRREISKPEWHVPKEVRRLARRFPSRFADDEDR